LPFELVMAGTSPAMTTEEPYAGVPMMNGFSSA
jgi:hypothetical protein